MANFASLYWKGNVEETCRQGIGKRNSCLVLENLLYTVILGATLQEDSMLTWEVNNTNLDGWGKTVEWIEFLKNKGSWERSSMWVGKQRCCLRNVTLKIKVWTLVRL